MRKAEFDSFANDYRNILTQTVQGISGADGDYFSEYKILEIKDLLVGKKILDFGCGDGNSARFINKNVKDYQYFGIDISGKSIEKAIEKNISGCSFSHYDGETIPFEDNYFDIVFISCVFHHIESTKHIDVLKEIYRVLNENGKVIIFEHNPLNPFTLKAVHDCPFDIDVKLVCAPKMRRRIYKAGFPFVKTRFTLFFPRKPFFMKFLGFEKYFYWCFLGAQYYCIGQKTKI